MFSQDTICNIHQRLCHLLPEDLLWVEDPESKEKIKIIPGQLRSRDVKVGNHIAISPGAVPRFLSRFQSVYEILRKSEMILALAAIHHRLLWIHPFLDGNGRVGRLLLNWLLLRKKLAPLAIPSAKREQYITALENAQRGNLKAISQFCYEEYIQQYQFV